MKKYIIFLLVLSAYFGMAQETTTAGWQTNTKDKCFCCNSFYNLPTAPAITGPTSVVCDTRVNYTTINCPGAVYAWSVTPNQAIISGQGTNSIVLSPMYNASGVTVSVTIRCGDKIAKNQILVRTQQIPNCNQNFTMQLTESSSNYRVSATPQTPQGYKHNWYLYEVTACSNGSEIRMVGSLRISANGGVEFATPGITPFAVFGFQYSGFLKDKTYKLVQYVSCCGQWKMQSKCFMLGGSKVLMSASDFDSKASIITLENVPIDKLPQELKRGQ